MASVKFRSERSAAGEKLDVLKSALQKYVRRGEGEKADWCMGQLLSFVGAPEGMPRVGAVLRNVAHRLMIIALEDAGNCPWVLEEVDAGTRALLHYVARGDAPGGGGLGEVAEALARAVAALVGAPKSRACSHARSLGALYAGGAGADYIRERWPAVWELYAGYAAGEGAGPPAGAGELLRTRGPEAYLRLYRCWEAAPGIRGRREIVGALGGGWKVGGILLGWLEEIQHGKDANLCAWAPMVWAVRGADPPEAGRVVWPPGRALERWVGAGRMELDPYVFDRHVGGAKERSMAHFVRVGAHVENQSPLVDAYLQEFYVDTRVAREAGVFGPPAAAPAGGHPHPAGVAGGAVPGAPLAGGEEGGPRAPDSEVGAFRYVVRGQLVPSAHKQDVYAAEHRVLGRVFVKGPYRSPEAAEAGVAAAEWKRGCGLPAARAVVLWLVPDRWPGGTPLGARNAVDRRAPAPFLVTESLLEEWPPRKAVKSSARWPPTEVLETDRSWDPVAMWGGASPTERRDYVLAICARYAMGIPDFADRNFCRSGGRVVGIDEDVAQHVEPRMEGELRGAEKRALIAGWIREHHAELVAELWRWAPPPFEGGEGRLQKLRGLPPGGFW